VFSVKVLTENLIIINAQFELRLTAATIFVFRMHTARFAICALSRNPFRTSIVLRQNKERPKSSKISPYHSCYQSSQQRGHVPSRLKCVRKRTTKINTSRNPEAKSVDISTRHSPSNLKDSRQDRIAKVNVNGFLLLYHVTLVREASLVRESIPRVEFKSHAQNVRFAYSVWRTEVYTGW